MKMKTTILFITLIFLSSSGFSKVLDSAKNSLRPGDRLTEQRIVFQDFLKSDKNIKEGTVQYTEAFVIPTNNNKEAKEGAMSELDKGYYNLLGSNCAETVQKALEGAGLDAGRLPKSIYPFPYSIQGVIMTPNIMIFEKVPAFIYLRIKNNNEGSTIKPNIKDENKR